MSLARYVTTRLIDDLDGSEAAETVCFSLDGRSYEVDLSERNLADLRTALEPFVTAARQVSGGSAGRRIAGRAAAGTARAEVSSGTSGEKAAVRGRSRTPVGGAAGDTSPGVRGPVAYFAGTASADPVPERQVAAPAEGSPPLPERKRAPLVADPFNPDLRIV